jgi:hypothetical protein
MRPNFYRSFEEFEREELRPSRSRVGFSLDDLIEESVFDSEAEVDEFDEED